jgi:ABC-type transport system involved in cytochrome c biogenesis permease subunit
MIRLIRIVGFLLITTGGVLVAVWAIEPLRFLWPWFRSLPWPIQLGLGAAGAGLILLLGTVIWERLEEREQDRELLDEP